MKKLFVFLLAVFAFNLTYAQEGAPKKEEAKGPVITFAEASHNFGDIAQGDKIDYKFKFKNTGTEPLILSNVLTQCGCTATDWNKEPIAPGKSGEIAVTFNSAGKSGAQNKIVTVVSNATNSQERVKISANVLPKKDGNL